MPYERLRDHLVAADGLPVVCLPDGSVDTLCRVYDGGHTWVESREVFGRRIAAGESRSFRLEPYDRQPGGQSVNAARQAHALGDEVTLFGHLDHPLLALPFETFSMGTPAEVTVLSFDRTDLMLSQGSLATDEWSFADLHEGGAPFRARVERAGSVVLANWVSFRDLTPAMRTLATYDLGAPVVLDPGDLSGSAPDEIGALRDAMATLDGTTPVVLSANGAEVGALADALGVMAAESPARERALREALGIAAVVRHDTAAAVAATDDRFGGAAVRVENFEAREIRRRTGAGDRFTAGLAHALGSGLAVAPALALGNACATYFIEHGETGTREDLAAFLEARSFPSG
ncbi:PfkB family carbohydrate kinase [Haloglomus litoreum]|uniref:PfkB family carbohydrate kinase n=1 Tax=Haloglomus litoreum TaxID=3034026 RepID=UPI0023E815C1|nr:PfkB family carbohydrate kinase [Haloglomus sp. DT116]